VARVQSNSNMDNLTVPVARLAVTSPWPNLRGIYTLSCHHEGRPAFRRVMKEGMDPLATTWIFFSSRFGPGNRWYFGTALPGESSMRSFSIALEDSAGAPSPELARWPYEDIFEVKVVQDEDEENEYFFPRCGENGQTGGGHRTNHNFDRLAMDKNLEVLGLPGGGSPNMATVKKEYRRLALLYHPDKPTGNKELFQRLQNAYEAVVEGLLRESGRAQCSQPEAEAGGGRNRKPPSEAEEDNGTQTTDTEGMQGISEMERNIRRQKALDAALRRQT